MISIKIDILIEIIPLKTFLSWRNFSNKRLGGCESQIFFINDQNTGRGDRIVMRGLEVMAM